MLGGYRRTAADRGRGQAAPLRADGLAAICPGRTFVALVPPTSNVTFLTGDCREVLRTLPDVSVHCCVTSPPYWGLRSYTGDPGMIGLEKTFDEHLETLVAVFREVRRVLRDDGTLWLNYGDAYASTPPGNKKWMSAASTLNGAHDFLTANDGPNFLRAARALSVHFPPISARGGCLGAD